MTPSNPKIVVAQWLNPMLLELLGKACDVELHPGDQPLGVPDLLCRSRDADGILIADARGLDEAFLSACPGLRLLGVPASRPPAIRQQQSCERRGVWVVSFPSLLLARPAELNVDLAADTVRPLFQALSGDRPESALNNPSFARISAVA